MEQKPIRAISEAEFAANYEKVRRDLARLIAYSGLTLSQIARATRMKWDTVYAASQGRSVRSENAARLRYFLENYNTQAYEKTTNQPADLIH